MTLKLKAEIEKVSNNVFIASIVNNDNFKGTIVEAETCDDAIKELLTSLKVKIAFDYNIEIDSIRDEEEVSSYVKNRSVREEDKKESLDLIF